MKIAFSNKWNRGWMQEYNVSLRKPSKRFQIKQADNEVAFLNTSKISRQCESSL